MLPHDTNPMMLPHVLVGWGFLLEGGWSWGNGVIIVTYLAAASLTSERSCRRRSVPIPVLGSFQTRPMNQAFNENERLVDISCVKYIVGYRYAPSSSGISRLLQIDGLVPAVLVELGAPYFV